MTECIRRPNSYWTTCQCGPCRTERRRKRKLLSIGSPYRIPAAVAERILIDHLDEGWTDRALASACGLRVGYFSRHVSAYKRGTPMLHIGPSLAIAIVRMGRATDGAVGSTGTARRLRALAAIGYGLKEIAAASGLGFSTLQMIRLGETTRVAAVRANVIADLYDEFQMTLGPNRAVAEEALSKGWPPPLAWDNIDNPLEEPQQWAYEPASRADLVAEVVDRGDGLSELCRMLHVSEKALEKWFEREGDYPTFSLLRDRDRGYSMQRNQDARSAS